MTVRDTTRTLESFSKEVLVAFVKSRLAFGARDWEAEMRRIERDVELDRIKARTEQIIADTGKCKLPGDWQEYKTLNDELDKLWARQDALLQET